jgi:hypothetical protein
MTLQLRRTIFLGESGMRISKRWLTFLVITIDTNESVGVSYE